VEHQIDAKALAGKVCWVEVSDIMEDCYFSLVGIPNILAARPEHLLVPEPVPPSE